MEQTPSSARPCPFCGYDLSGSPSGQCPECGRPVLRFTERARKIAIEANRQAIALLNQREPWWKPRQIARPQIEPAHVLLGIACGPAGVGLAALRACGIDPAQLRDHLLKRLPRGWNWQIAEIVKLPLAPATQRLVQVAIDRAFHLGHNWVGTEHFLLALCGGAGDTFARRALAKFDITDKRVEPFIKANMAALQKDADPRV